MVLRQLDLADKACLGNSALFIGLND